jgi:hypothetical protein
MLSCKYLLIKSETVVALSLSNLYYSSGYEMTLVAACACTRAADAQEAQLNHLKQERLQLL